ncbi:hypothetical protein pb186bvf_021211 [Paramecium bursaria]
MNSRNNFQNNGSRISNQEQQPLIQQQTQLPQIQSSVQLQEMKYTVYQDLENNLLMLAQTRAVLDYFKDQQESHPMITVAINRLIQQLNLSNAIHFDQYQISLHNESLKQELIKLKKITKDIYQKLSVHPKNNTCLRPFCQIYEEVVLKQDKFQYEQLNLSYQAPYNNEISPHIIQKLLQQIQTVDQTYSTIRNGSNHILQPDIDQLQLKMSEKQSEAISKLSLTFTKQKNQFKRNNYAPISPSTSVNKERFINQLINKVCNLINFCFLIFKVKDKNSYAQKSRAKDLIKVQKGQLLNDQGHVYKYKDIFQKSQVRKFKQL